MSPRITILILLMLVMAGCTAPEEGGASGAACAAAQLGIITDENFQVLTVIPDNAAESAGVRVGDILVDLTWIAVESLPRCVDTIPINPQGTPEPPSGIRATPAPGEAFDYPAGAIPFTDSQQIRHLTEYGVILELRVKRGDGEIKLRIRPAEPKGQSGDSDPDHHYF